MSRTRHQASMSQSLTIPALLAALLCLGMLRPHAATAQQDFRILVPPGRVAFPMVLFVPGCSGFNAANGINHYEARANELLAAGYAVVFVDYVGRRMQTNCAHITPGEVATDVLDAATWARDQSGTDRSRISVIGWSFGGGGVLAALQSMPPGSPIAKAVLYYPVCRGAAPWSAAVHGLMLLGAKDDIAYPTLCMAVTNGAPADLLRVITYKEARHGFDNPGFPERANPPPGAPVYNTEAASESWAAVLEFLK